VILLDTPPGRGNLSGMAVLTADGLLSGRPAGGGPPPATSGPPATGGLPATGSGPAGGGAWAISVEPGRKRPPSRRRAARVTPAARSGRSLTRSTGACGDRRPSAGASELTGAARLWCFSLDGNSGDVLPRDQRQTEVKLNAAARELDLLRERLEGRVEESPGMQALRQAPSRAGSST
jgi:hypothetical protein